MLLTVVGCDAPVTLTSATFLLETVRIVEAAPFERLHLRLPAFELERTKPIVQAASQEAQALTVAESLLGAQFDLTLGGGMNSPLQLLEYATVLERASLWQRLFGREYRQALKVYCRVARAGKKAGRPDMSRALRDIAAYINRRVAFENHAACCEALGSYFQGMSSPWEDLHAMLVWYEQVFVALPEHQAHAEPLPATPVHCPH